MKKRMSLIAVLLVVFLSGFAANAKELILWDNQTDAEVGSNMVADAIVRFEADHPGVKVKHVAVKNDDYKTKLQIAMVAGDTPDIFSSWGGGVLESYVRAGRVYDMTDKLLETGWVDRFVSAGLGAVSYDERHYGVPGTTMSGAFVWYRPSLFAEYGVEVPTTWDEMIEVAQVFKDNGITPFALANATKWTGSLYYMNVVNRLAGPEAFERAVSREGAFNDEPFVKASEMIQELVDKGFFPVGVNGLREDQGQSRLLLYSNRAAMYVGLQSVYPLMKNENPEVAAEIDVFSFPVIEGGQGNPTNLIGSPGQNYYSIAESCTDKDLAFKLIQYLTDEKAQEVLIASGAIPALQGTDEMLTDRLTAKVFSLFAQADNVQLYYDQALPPELGDIHKDTMHGLFGKTMTPQEIADTLERAAQRYYDEN